MSPGVIIDLDQALLARTVFSSSFFRLPILPRKMNVIIKNKRI